MSAKQQFLDTCEREHATTVKILRAFPADKADMRPHPKLRTAKELAWIFALECYLGIKVMKKEFGDPNAGKPPEAPDSLDKVISEMEKLHRAYVELVRSYSEEELKEGVTFMVGPKKTGEIPRLTFAWFLLHDEIHHRGQFSVYLRIADAKVPSIYGPTADEPWM